MGASYFCHSERRIRSEESHTDFSFQLETTRIRNKITGMKMTFEKQGTKHFQKSNNKNTLNLTSERIKWKFCNQSKSIPFQ